MPVVWIASRGYIERRFFRNNSLNRNSEIDLDLCQCLPLCGCNSNMTLLCLRRLRDVINSLPSHNRYHYKTARFVISLTRHVSSRGALWSYDFTWNTLYIALIIAFLLIIICDISGNSNVIYIFRDTYLPFMILICQTRTNDKLLWCLLLICKTVCGECSEKKRVIKGTEPTLLSLVYMRRRFDSWRKDINERLSMRNLRDLILIIIRRFYVARLLNIHLKGRKPLTIFFSRLLKIKDNDRKISLSSHQKSLRHV